MLEGLSFVMQERWINQMRALIAQAVAEARQERRRPLVAEVQLIAYGGIDPDEVVLLFYEASQGTLAEDAAVIVQHTGSRYICWNCCGLRFESADGACPNCGEVALEVPEEIAFALRGVKAVDMDGAK